MDRCILALNAGSSSLKFGLFRLHGGEVERVAYGACRSLPSSRVLAIYSDAGEQIHEAHRPEQSLDIEEMIHGVMDGLKNHFGSISLAAIGHRVVHGGTRFSDPVMVDTPVIRHLESLATLAPLHELHGVEAIKNFRRLEPDVPQVACFDTAFHQSIPQAERYFGLPRALADQGIRRYGFHGLSYESLHVQLKHLRPQLAGERLILAHLGNGASLCALKGGESVATTMGFSTLDGLVMGTRCGSLDPGVILYLQNEKGISARQIERLLYRESGLLGLSGISSDLQVLQSSADPRAELAIEVFVHQVVRHIGGLMMSLQGLDAIVFSGGIGEHEPRIRQKICERLHWLDLQVDEEANARNDLCFSTHNSRVQALVIPTKEELMIARHSARTVQLHTL